MIDAANPISSYGIIHCPQCTFADWARRPSWMIQRRLNQRDSNTLKMSSQMTEAEERSIGSGSLWLCSRLAKRALTAMPLCVVQAFTTAQTPLKALYASSDVTESFESRGLLR